MSELSKKAMAGLVRFQAMLALLLFLPAWSIRFWEAWLYWSLFAVSVLLITLYFLKHDPRLDRAAARGRPGRRAGEEPEDHPGGGEPVC